MFFFDVAKGLVLGAVGVVAINSEITFAIKSLNVFGSVGIAFVCIKIGLHLLNEQYD